jgi:hypothetical protein
MGEAGGVTGLLFEEANVIQQVAAADAGRHAPQSDVELAADNPSSDTPEVLASSKGAWSGDLALQADAFQFSVGFEELDPGIAAAQLKKHHAARVEFVQLCPVRASQRVKYQVSCL